MTDAPIGSVLGLEPALAFTRLAHAGQFDKTGQPYADHPHGVALGAARILDDVSSALVPDRDRPDVLRAALLHDVVEDTALTFDDLRAEGFSERTVEIVDLLTRREDETYVRFIDRIATSRDAGAIVVKLADLADNMDPARVLKVPEEARIKGERYVRARAILQAALARADTRDAGGT